MHSLPFVSRIGVALRVLFNGEFAARAVVEPLPELPKAAPQAPVAADTSALVLLSLLQAEARFLDFVSEDIAAFSDADVGAAARQVHDGCAKVITRTMTLGPVLDEAEGSRITIEDARDANTYKIVGKSRTRPFEGTVKHRGWRASQVKLPSLLQAADASLLSPAEIETA